MKKFLFGRFSGKQMRAFFVLSMVVLVIFIFLLIGMGLNISSAFLIGFILESLIYLFFLMTPSKDQKKKSENSEG